MAGTVTQLNLTVGQIAGAGQTAVTLSDLTTLSVDIGLDESDIAQVSLSQAALVTLDAFDNMELQGTIIAIAPTADVQAGVVLYPVTIALDPSALPVRAGMTADVEIVTSSAEDVVLVPLKAVRSVGGRSFILRKLKAGESAPPAATNEVTAQMNAQMTTLVTQMTTAGFVLVPVQLGLVTDTYAEVLSGLEEGDVISIASSAPVSEEPSGPGFMMGGPR